MLLLDDVSSELDPERNAFLMRYLAESGAQTLLTTTDAALVQRAAGPDTKWFRVRAGGIEAGAPA
jgi:DNA replication and repair protein RecF